MSVHYIYKGAGGAKMMRPVPNREEYLKLRNGGFQVSNLKRIRAGEERLKADLVQMNYSCLPNADGSLKGSKTASMSVGMDIDFKAPCNLSDEERRAWLAECMAKVPEMVLAKREALGLLMLERSATKGYHLVFRRRPELSQEANLKWASDLLGVKFDDKAKDITRVFFTTTGDPQELLYLDDGIFDLSAAPAGSNQGAEQHSGSGTSVTSQATSQMSQASGEARTFPTTYHGIPFAEILKKYWEVNNRGFEPTEGDRDTLTYQLACDLRHICGKNAAWLDQVIPCYDGFPPEEKRQKIRNALSSPYEGFPMRLRNVLNALTIDHEPWTIDHLAAHEEAENEWSMFNGQ